MHYIYFLSLSPDDSVDPSHLVAHLPSALKAPAILHGEVLTAIPVAGEISLAVGAVKPLVGALPLQGHRGCKLFTVVG